MFVTPEARCSDYMACELYEYLFDAILRAEVDNAVAGKLIGYVYADIFNK